MATKTHRALSIARSIFAWLMLATGLFMLCAWIGSSIPRNSGWVEPESGITIMIETNGIHTGIVMPIVSPQKDWRQDFPAADLPAATLAYTHISVSWGEREVFLNTPTWHDLRLSTAIGAITGGDGLLHAAHYVRPSPSEYHRELNITPAQYAKIIAAIEQQIIPPDQRTVHAGYGPSDVFYDAPGTYHIANTCNQWTSDTLAAAGIKTGWWTPFAGGVMKWVPKADQR